MKKNKGIAIILFTFIAIGFLGYVCILGLGSTGTGAAKNIKLGLDLAGGVSITYQAVGDTPSDEEMGDTIGKLEKRVENYSTEASVYQVGNDRITVEIPGVTDANAILEDLGKPGSLTFQDEDGNILIEGTDIADAQAASIKNDMGNKEFIVELTFTDEGAKKFADATSKNVGKSMPIVYDDQTISAPKVQAAISGGKAQIDGMESYEAADELASSIRIGALKVELEELSSRVVAAKLGGQAIETSLKAAAIGLALVVLFMCVYYLIPGVVASIALVLYTAMILITLNAFNVTLTLPGIAGIVLSIGMAVDANVIIFARIREELTEGISVKTALENGFSKAFSAIFDGNITTLIAAIVLQIKGSGTVKGFAQTLAIGVILSMFTALVVTRFLLKAFHALGLKNPKMYGINKPFKTFDFIGKRKIFYAISLVCCIAGLAFLGVNKSSTGSILNFSLDFAGGTSTTVSLNEKYTIDELDSDVKPVVSEVTNDNNIEIQKDQNSNDVIIKTRTLSLDEREALNKKLIETFKVEESSIQSETISSTISSEMRSDAIVSVVIALILMLLYIWFRFKDIKFASSAVLALFHDVLIVFAYYSISRASVGTTFIAVMLTIVGYSINATIVIFDRVREKLKYTKPGDDIKTLCNESITQTLSRSINTSLTDFIMLLVLYILGVTSVKEFAAPLMIGIIGGAYSSVCITTSLWYTFGAKSRAKFAATAVKTSTKKNKAEAVVNGDDLYEEKPVLAKEKNPENRNAELAVKKRGRKGKKGIH
ncbi:SecD/SecF fusion protein [Acetitomaculum ruminis DSM 5522]|uniref:Multifunctional fusion protein n=1 Tax=Acetitomaculum ruminis DSM 5522 TaxID=1120918 RepID=A0A1I0VQN7_9FIRM|nr:protein translocase subunit SecD [Acetitomaculum ruminis]SFA78652.1 SecD/SecF fusion protein [Acetitomaculum ruminis DSM 5522]